MRMQPRKRISGQLQPIYINEPRDIEHRQVVAEQIWLAGEPPVQVVQRLAEPRRRHARGRVTDAALGKPRPEIDLPGDPRVLLALNSRLSPWRRMFFKIFRRFRRFRRREDETETERANVEMQIVFVLEELGDLIFILRRNEPRLRKRLSR